MVLRNSLESYSMTRVHTSLMMCIGVCRVFKNKVHILLQDLHFDVVVILVCSSRIVPSTDSNLGFKFFPVHLDMQVAYLLLSFRHCKDL